MKCPACGMDGSYVGFSTVECPNPKCVHYKVGMSDTVKRTCSGNFWDRVEKEGKLLAVNRSKNGPISYRLWRMDELVGFELVCECPAWKFSPASRPPTCSHCRQYKSENSKP